MVCIIVFACLFAVFNILAYVVPGIFLSFPFLFLFLFFHVLFPVVSHGAPLKTGNECTDNHDAGLSLVETSRCSVTDNTFGTNRWGFRVTLGSTDNVVR